MGILLMMVSLTMNSVSSEAETPYIIELQTKTSTADGAGCDCDVSVAIFNQEGFCITDLLDANGDDFESGELDSFGEFEGLGECFQFPVDASNEGWSIEVIHSGSDGWFPEYVKILATNLIFVSFKNKSER